MSSIKHTRVGDHKYLTNSEQCFCYIPNLNKIYYCNFWSRECIIVYRCGKWKYMSRGI